MMHVVTCFPEKPDQPHAACHVARSFRPATSYPMPHPTTHNHNTSNDNNSDNDGDNDSHNDGHLRFIRKNTFGLGNFKVS